MPSFFPQLRHEQSAKLTHQKLMLFNHFLDKGVYVMKINHQLPLHFQKKVPATKHNHFFEIGHFPFIIHLDNMKQKDELKLPQIHVFSGENNPIFKELTGCPDEK